MYGDMGRTGGAPSLRRLKSEAHSGRYAAFIHSGDFAYNFNDEEGVVSTPALLFLGCCSILKSSGWGTGK